MDLPSKKEFKTLKIEGILLYSKFNYEVSGKSQVFLHIWYFHKSFFFMKFLNILRHGESEPYHQDSDYQRRLTTFGRNQLQFLANKIVQKEIVIESILCSSATRTRETCQLILDKIPITHVKFSEELYECDLTNLLKELKQVENQTNHLLLIGHNPGLSALVSYLTGEFFLSMSPGDFVQLSLEIDDWNFLSQDIALLSSVLR